MTRILYYTDATNASSFSGSSPLSFGTSKTRTTTRTGLYDALISGLTAMGWTQHNLGTRNDVWTSTGESGNESINVQTFYDGTRVLYFYVGTKIDGSGNLQGGIGGTGTNTYEAWDLQTIDFTADYVVFGTKDFFFWFIYTQTTGTGGVPLNTPFCAILGNAERNAMLNANTMITNATASAGSLVSISLTANPITAGYVPGELVQIVSQATGDAAQAQTVRIVGTTTSTITVDSLAATYSSGARIGSCPSPIVRFVGKNNLPNDTTAWYSPLTFTFTGSTSDLISEPGQPLTGIEFSAGTTATAQDGFGTSNVGNKRTRRFSMRSIELKMPNEAVLGRAPGIYALPNSLYTHNPNSTVSWNRFPGGGTKNFLVMNFGATYWAVGYSP